MPLFHALVYAATAAALTPPRAANLPTYTAWPPCAANLLIYATLPPCAANLPIYTARPPHAANPPMNKTPANPRLVCITVPSLTPANRT